MKKMLKAVSGFAIACLLVIGICATVFAAGSQSDGTNVTSTNAAFVATPNAASQTFDEAGARAALSLNGGTVAVYNWDMYTTDGTAASVTFNPNGATSAQTLYVMHYVNGAWVKEAEGAGPTITNNFSSFSPVALVVYTPAGGKKSDVTGASNILLFIALAAIAVGGVTAGIVARNKA